ncbi:MAG: iron-sulfur binding hydrogenase [Mesoaciditoga sp.]|uniref:iron-sulfur binding hydrogenase n=1 Tax=Athalassotoga sp. TaxID=2022597 RepID=UPI000CBDFA2C|nr:MAG: iron-sulfur binding hydrogenase [Mesoaciditoga sp.]HEU23520.1 iron-sulfur binding hydrogenase [Mesoaciditoga lauensis]
MKIEELKDIGFEMVTGGEGEINHGYACDLLSEVMGRAKPDTVWLTVQSHVNIIAVAAITGIRAIILCNDHLFDEETVQRAKKEKIALFKTSLNTFEACGKIYQKGIR